MATARCIYRATAPCRRSRPPGGYDQPQLVYACLYEPTAVALDGAGNLFVADLDGQVVELPAASGYSQVKLLVSGLLEPTSLAFDGAGNLFVGDNTVYELPAADGYRDEDRRRQRAGRSRPRPSIRPGISYFTQLEVTMASHLPCRKSRRQEGTAAR